MLESLFLAQDGNPTTAEVGPREPVPTEEAPSINPFASLAPFLVIGVIFWFLILGPERKNRRRREQTIANLKKNDEVMTTSGMYGRIARMDGDMITLQVADGIRLRFNRVAIQGLANEPDGAQAAKGGDEDEDEDGADDAKDGESDDAK